MTEQGYAEAKPVERNNANLFCRRMNTEGWQVKNLYFNVHFTLMGGLVERVDTVTVTL
jgi:hypothetical protein